MGCYLEVNSFFFKFLSWNLTTIRKFVMEVFTNASIELGLYMAIT